MTKTLLALSLLLALFGLSRSAPALPPFDSSSTSTAAEDVTGNAWALGTGMDSGKLDRWQKGHWEAQDIPGTAGFRVRVLTRGANGSVYALWQQENQTPNQATQSLVTVHRSLSSHVFVQFSSGVSQNIGFPDTPAIYAGSGGDVWVTGSQLLLWHIAPNGTVQTFPLRPEQFFDGKPAEFYSNSGISSLVDSAGRRWFWQDGARMDWQHSGLRGVLIWDGKTLAYHATLTGVPDQPFTALAPLDANHFWVATGLNLSHWPQTGGSLFQLDTRTLSALPERPPASESFQITVQIFGVNGDWYAVERTQNGSVPVALWRKRDGQWRKYLGKLADSGGYSSPDARSPWLAEPSGTWFGVSRGAWWLPRGDQPPVWVDWRRGLGTPSVRGLFPLADGSILAYGGDSGSAPIRPTPQPVHPLPDGVAAGGMGAPPGMGSLLADPRSHLWGTHPNQAGSVLLDEWDGRRWRTHLPPKTVPGVSSLYACDTLGRLWLATSNWNPPAQPQPVYGYAVYDPARDSWTNYVTIPEALQAAAALPGMGFLPNHDLYQPPIFSGDGKVTYLKDNATTLLYDGEIWHHWETRDIVPDYQYGTPQVPPHFSADGKLEVAFNDYYWDWTPASGWQQGEVYRAPANEDPVPPGGPPGLWGTPAVDELGVKWFVWQNAVYVAGYGYWAKQAVLSAPGSPFTLGYGIESILTDPVGRLFFVSRPAGYYDYIVWTPPMHVIKPTLAVSPASEDSVRVRLQSGQKGPHLFLWRLNGGAWSVPTHDHQVMLTTLAHGDYRVEVETLDSRLQRSPSAFAVFSIRVATNVQIAHWVSVLLKGTENARENAVAGLVKQNEASLPALEAARPTATEDARWWIDAAIQQIQDQKQPAD